MDIMIPYLGQITRLTAQNKSVFQIAGVQKSAPEKRLIDNKKKQWLDEQSKHNHNEIDKESDDDENASKSHLDTWA
ncbi:hypothetical protein J8L70_09125 [Pseudoalteromonas sp. MMG010]|uniref:hypothetical protein n=1 Tax=Pseudoalteromonas sp. MMG010 TaxID=2822685 RepID=UPI001B39FDE6|nr:hypothetical protein [Pseudoalteromonas sp. MMG010]MBQ4833397.1 hypothetical protein [Pseudoalteromonas sp. MMG010]